ncbi:hypothetical protein PR202_ga19129 [Eleusine coracana subsp. coracana]|uniref:KIB1-4 beta-propeller domain-containing protein n=1 Tax=Eleusine coracana subsp. coracana TaxID=191504 RepID=A0AAV5CTE7_ELECO|nr:hypothetical protein PR202_ga19129 [Eleusine coracana subsp. coracana]
MTAVQLSPKLREHKIQLLKPNLKVGLAKTLATVAAGGKDGAELAALYKETGEYMTKWPFTVRLNKVIAQMNADPIRLCKCPSRRRKTTNPVPSHVLIHEFLQTRLLTAQGRNGSEKSPPPPAGVPCCCGVPRGWLALSDHDKSPTRLLLWDPTSGAEIALPPLNNIVQVFLSDVPLITTASPSPSWVALASQRRDELLLVVLHGNDHPCLAEIYKTPDWTTADQRGLELGSRVTDLRGYALFLRADDSPWITRNHIYFLPHSQATQIYWLLIKSPSNLVHPFDELIDVVLTVTSITALHIVVPLLLQASKWCLQLEWPQEVVSLHEMWANRS